MEQHYQSNHHRHLLVELYDAHLERDSCKYNNCSALFFFKSTFILEDQFIECIGKDHTKERNPHIYRAITSNDRTILKGLYEIMTKKMRPIEKLDPSQKELLIKIRKVISNE